MKRSDVKELHYITHINNLPSIFQYGIFSYESVKRIKSISVASIKIQNRRENKQIPNGLRLHQYANLYFHARNPMISALRDQHKNLCVLRISSSVLELQNVIVSDMNASSDYVGFFPALDGINRLNRNLVYSEDWRHPDPPTYYRQKSIKCAEVLVPDQISPKHIEGVYVSNIGTKKYLSNIAKNIPIIVNPHLFFAD